MAEASYWNELRGVLGRMWADGVASAASSVNRVREEGRSIEDKLRQLSDEIWKEVVEDWTVSWRSDPIPTVRNQFYGHGAFMGAAPALLENHSWRRILAFLMPDVHLQVAAAVRGGAATGALIPMFENNPVMCAFGVWQGVQARREGGFGRVDLQGMEWDVFLDGRVIFRYEKADSDKAIGEAVSALIDGMLVAHASTTDTVQEALGVDQYVDVRATPKTAMGGVEAGHWMDLFGRALELAAAPDLDAAIRQMAAEERSDSAEQCLRHCFAQPRPWTDAVGRYRALTGLPCFSVVLEVKSRRSTPVLLMDLVGEINRRGVHVAGVGTFLLPEVTGVSGYRQVVDGCDYPGPREVLFVHYAGDVQRACDRDEVPRGQSVLFNGASLIDADSPPPGARAFDVRASYRIKADVIEELAEYKTRFDLHLGLYVQEGDTDGTAAGLLAMLAEQREDVFDLGFAWGGLRDHAVDLGSPFGDHRGYGGQRMLEFVGQARQWETKAMREAAAARRAGGNS